LNSFQDALFNNEMNTVAAEAIQQYGETNFKLALRAGFYDLTSSRDFYREACAAAGIQMHHDLLLKYIELQAVCLAPLAPHWAEYIWMELLKKLDTIHNARFPQLPVADPGLTAAREYVRITASSVNSAETAQMKKKAKGKEISFDPKLPKKLTVFMTERFPAWQEKYIDLVKEMWDPATNTVNDKELNGKIGKMGEMKKAMPFVQGLKRRLQAGEAPSAVLERKLAFDEKNILLEMVPGLKRTAGLTSIDVVAVDEGAKTGTNLAEGKTVQITSPNAEAAVPGVPTYLFENVKA
jgi:leucyl-tRNA synthetase